MDPSIRPAGSVDPNLPPKELFQSALQDFLNSNPVGLNLPAVIVGPVVFDRELNIHGMGFESRVSSFESEDLTFYIYLKRTDLANLSPLPNYYPDVFRGP